jgi:hypothetical protein
MWGALRRLRIEPPERELMMMFRHQHDWNTARNIEFRRQLGLAVETLNAVGIVPLLFKGSLSLVDGSIDDLGGRWMGDLDIAVPLGTRATAVGALHDIGYEPTPGDQGRHEFTVAKKGTPGPIELHVDLGLPPLSTVLPVSDAWADSIEVGFASVRARGLSPTHQVLQCILHSALQDFNHAFAGLPLRQLLTLARLVEAHPATVNWSDIYARAESQGFSTVVRDHLWLAHRFAGLPLPQGDWDGIRPRLHELWVLANFSLGWPPDLRMRLHWAFDRTYLDSLYRHDNRLPRFAAARTRHLINLLRRDWRGNLSKAFEQRT